MSIQRMVEGVRHKQGARGEPPPPRAEEARGPPPRAGEE